MKSVGIIAMTIATATAFSNGPSSFFFSARKASSSMGVPRRSRQVLFGIIEADTPEEATSTFDEGLGGVRLAMESAIQIVGDVVISGNNGDGVKAVAKDLKRYTKVTPISKQQDMKGMMILCQGAGTELYLDPGTSTIKNVILAPSDAVRNALSSLSPSQRLDDKKSVVVINFLGGDDLMLNEVLDATEQMVKGLQMEDDGKKVLFRSLCHSQFPSGRAFVTVVSFDNNQSNEGEVGNDMEEKDVPFRGEIYYHQNEEQQDEWWTVLEEDINLAVA